MNKITRFLATTIMMFGRYVYLETMNLLFQGVKIAQSNYETYKIHKETKFLQILGQLYDNYRCPEIICL